MRERGRGDHQNPKLAPCTKLAKLGASRGRDSEIDSSVGAKGAESGGKDRQIRRLFHPD
jgi:hypothetical protein